MAYAYRVGRRYERKCLYEIARQGVVCLYVSGSGRGKSRFSLPDIVCLANGRCALIEVKRRGDDRPIYLDKDKFLDLKELERITGCRVLICTSYRVASDLLCLDINDYDYETDRYIVYTRSSFFSRGLPPSEVMSR